MSLRCCPWSNWAEWEQCRNLIAQYQTSPLSIEQAARAPLFAESSLNDVRQGLAIIQMWRSRMRVPHVIESTAAIQQARANDFLYHAVPMSGGAMLYSLRLEYSMAIVRFVNGLVEPLQQKVHAQSVALLAEQLNLPRELVDVRHEATHAMVPSLSMLRIASTLALQWVKTAYWDQQHDRIGSMQHSSALSAIVDQYDQTAKGQGNQQTARILKQLTSFANQTEGACATLVELIFPVGSRALCNPCPYETFTVARLNSLFKENQHKWNHLLNGADKKFGSFRTDVLEYLVSRLVSLQSPNMVDDLYNEWQQQLIAKWLVTLIKQWKPTSAAVLKSLLVSLSSVECDASYQVTSALLEQLKTVLPDNQLKNTVAAVLNGSTAADDDSIDDSQIHELIQAKSGSASSVAPSVDADDIDWSQYPLGVLPNSSESTFSVFEPSSFGDVNDMDQSSDEEDSGVDVVNQGSSMVSSTQSSLLLRDWTVSVGLSEWLQSVGFELQNLS